MANGHPTVRRGNGGGRGTGGSVTHAEPRGPTSGQAASQRPVSALSSPVRRAHEKRLVVVLGLVRVELGKFGNGLREHVVVTDVGRDGDDGITGTGVRPGQSPPAEQFGLVGGGGRQQPTRC